MRQEGRGIGLANKVRAYALQAHGADTVDANRLLGLPVDARRYDAAAAMLGALLLMGTATRVRAAVLIDSFETQVPWGVLEVPMINGRMVVGAQPSPTFGQLFSITVTADTPPTAVLTQPTVGATISGTNSEFFGDGNDDVGTVRAGVSAVAVASMASSAAVAPVIVAMASPTSLSGLPGRSEAFATLSPRCTSAMRRRV